MPQPGEITGSNRSQGDQKANCLVSVGLKLPTVCDEGNIQIVITNVKQIFRIYVRAPPTLYLCTNPSTKLISAFFRITQLRKSTSPA